MGLLDFKLPDLNSPEGQGLLAASLSLMQARQMPGQSGAFGAALGQAGQQYMGVRNQAASQGAENEMQRLKLDALKRQAAQDKQLSDAARMAYRSPEQASAMSMGPMQDGGSLPQVQPGFDAAKYSQSLYAIDPMQGMAFDRSMAKENTINKLDVKDFTPQSVAKYAKTRNYGDLVRLDKAHFANTGGQTVAMDAFTGQPLTQVNNTQSPDSKASLAEQARARNQTNALGWANHNLTASRDALTAAEGGKPQLVDGQWVYRPTAQNPIGRVVNVAGMNDKPLNESQGAATNFGMRALKAHEIISELEKTGEGKPGNIKRFATAATPGLGMNLDDSVGTLMNWTQSDSQQKAEQAQINFITAVLRKESGASISPGEFVTAKKLYFAQPNDGAAVLEEKRKARESAIEGLKAQAGPGAKHIKSENAGFDDPGKEARYQEWKRRNGQ